MNEVLPNSIEKVTKAAGPEERTHYDETVSHAI